MTPPLADAPTTQPTLLHELGSVSDFSAANGWNAERVNRWRYGLTLYRHAPVLGIGPGTFPGLYLDFVRSAPIHDSYYTTLSRTNAHNLYISWLIEAGALGLMSSLLLLGYTIVRQLQQVLRGQRSALAMGLAVYFLFFLLHSFTQDFWQEPRVIEAFWLVIGLQRYSRQTAARPAEKPRLA